MGDMNIPCLISFKPAINGGFCLLRFAGVSNRAGEASLPKNLWVNAQGIPYFFSGKAKWHLIERLEDPWYMSVCLGTCVHSKVCLGGGDMGVDWGMPGWESMVGVCAGMWLLLKLVYLGPLARDQPTLGGKRRTPSSAIVLIKENRGERRSPSIQRKRKVNRNQMEEEDGGERKRMTEPGED